MRRGGWLLVILLTLLSSTQARASAVRSWAVSSAEEFATGLFEGTSLDGERIEEIRIEDGMEFKIGPAVLRFLETGI